MALSTIIKKGDTVHFTSALTANPIRGKVTGIYIREKHNRIWFTIAPEEPTWGQPDLIMVPGDRVRKIYGV